MDLKRGTKAVQELEKNAVRISALIPELEEVKITLSALKEAEKSSQKQLKLYEENVAKLEAQLTESLQVKLAESLAEVSSRSKDLYDKVLVESTKTNDELKALQTGSLERASALEVMKDDVSKLSKSIDDLSIASKKAQTTNLRLVMVGVLLACGLALY